MKLVSSKETFEFKHDSQTTVSISPEPVKVSDEVAAHLNLTYGGMIQIQEVEADEASTEEVPTPAAAPAAGTQPEMVDHVITEADMEMYPKLAADGRKVGDTIQIPKAE